MKGKAFSASKMEPCRRAGYCSECRMHRQHLHRCNAASEPFTSCKSCLNDNAAQLKPSSRPKWSPI